MMHLRLGLVLGFTLILSNCPIRPGLPGVEPAGPNQNRPKKTPVKVAKFTITPDEVTAGQTVLFTVTLDRPAPDGGSEINFSSITNTGVTSTMRDMPVSWRFNKGATEMSLKVRTERRVPEATHIVFTAYNFDSQYSAELTIH